MAAAAKKVVLTDRGLKALKSAPLGKRYIVWDAQQPHLGVRVTDKGVKSFIVVKRRPGAKFPDTHVLGQYPTRTLKAAREEAPKIISMLSEGKSPKQAKDEAARLIARKRADTFETAVEQFVKYEKSKNLRSCRDTEGFLRREFLGQFLEKKREPAVIGSRKTTRWNNIWRNGKRAIWRERPIIEISRRDIVERLDEIKARNGKYAARHALGAVRKLFNWAAEGERFGIEASPALLVRDRTIGITGKDLKRTRVLTNAELRDIWHAASLAGYPFGTLVKILALTGQRLSDIAEAQWEEIDFTEGILRVPPERFKTGVAQEVPLLGASVAILKGIPRLEGPYVFSTTAGHRPISGISKMKNRLDNLIKKQRVADNAHPMPAWVLHDLRRTVRTRLTSDLNVDAFVAERILGHALPGLHGVYDQGSHRAPKLTALERWEELLLSATTDAGRSPHHFR